ncbi:MAG TPA: hypothetical protein VG433_16585, partial [Pirellulales bacterium]|nr:hypothetical protein [Pirellulales bacterium]
IPPERPMPEFGHSTAYAFLGAIQAVGLLSAWLARFTEGSHNQHWYQWLFFLCLLVLGLATIAALLSSPAACVVTGATLSVMVLAATWDFSAGKSAAI